jgi:hypothetical protein
MTVPTKAPFNTLTSHSSISRHGIFNKTSQQVTIVRQTVRERRTVIKNELVLAVFSGIAHFYRSSKSLVSLPVFENLALK